MNIGEYLPRLRLGKYSNIKYSVNIGEYLPRLRLGKYSPIFTEPEANNCFSIISELKNREIKTTLNTFYFRSNIFHFGYFLVGNLGKSAGSHFVFENKRLRAIFTALRGEYNAIVRIAQPIRLLKTRS